MSHAATRNAIREILVQLKDQQADVIGFKTVMRDRGYILVEGQDNQRLTLDEAVTTLARQSKFYLKGDERLQDALNAV